MNIAIFETDHYEGSYPVIRLFDTGKNNLTIFTNELCAQQFRFLLGTDFDRYKWVIRGKNQSKYQFIYSLAPEIKKRKIDLLWLNTVSNNHLLYAQVVKKIDGVRTILTIHDINGYFNFHPAFSLRRFVRYFGKRQLLNIVNEFNVVGEHMVQHLIKKLPPHKKVHNIPGCIFEPDKYVSPSSLNQLPLRIVTPGTLDPRRRNYNIVFDLLREAKQKELALEIVLLGGPNHEFGSALLQQCREAKKLFPNFKFFEEPVVDQPTFDQYMNSAHAVLLPSVHDTILFDGVTEVYGESICSGNIFDVIKHARPALIPDFLQIPHAMESSFLRFHSMEELISQLEELRKNNFTQKAYNNSLHFTAEVLRAKHPSLFQQE